ncbi:MAG: hypothetical protein ABSF13_07775 [Smithella sp.]|jgi:23S rRNA (cytidine1920-2'-O)/16S rRNA (cytidine1409-2'-O)-methyltransferase
MDTQKIRLDKLLIDRGITPTLEKARALILARAVKINEIYLDKAGALVPVDAKIHMKGEPKPPILIVHSMGVLIIQKYLETDKAKQ